MKYTKIIIGIFITVFFLGITINARADTQGGSSDTVSVLIRNGDTVIYSGAVPFPVAGTISVLDDTSTTHDINTQSVLGILYALDQSSDAFSISDLAYYTSFHAFYLKCISSSSTGSLCDNWQYAVDGNFPGSGLDSTMISPGQSIGIYFGDQHQLSLDRDHMFTGGSLTATAQKYDYEKNTWKPLTGVSIGVTVPNPSDPYNPTVVTSASVDGNGSATFTLTSAGTYLIGIVEDYYYPSYTVVVTPPPGGGGVTTVQTQAKTFDVQAALGYLKQTESTDGSFLGSDMYTDWAAIAYVAGGVDGASHDAMLSYLTSHNKLSTILTDNERHAMALLAFGQNPYSLGGIDYVTSITSAFDGTQFGDPSLVNDDIFALIVLQKTGYTVTDDLIAKDIVFILSKKKDDGSWEESVDLTASAIQALEFFKNTTGVDVAISKAGTYVQNNERSDGGFGSVSTTSWAMQAMNDLGATWIKDGVSPIEYLASEQAFDGGLLLSTDTQENRVWATSYAIPAALGKSWSAILHGVDKKVLVAQDAAIKTAPIATISTDTPSVLPAVVKKNSSTDTAINTSDSLKVDSMVSGDTQEENKVVLSGAAAQAISPQERFSPWTMIGVAFGIIVLVYSYRRFYLHK